MLDTRLPQLLSCTVVQQLKADGRLVLLKLTRSNLDIEVVALVGNFQNLRPSESIDAQSEDKNKQYP